jgi:hypothetical protein
MLWRRLFKWNSLPCAHRICLPLWARRFCCSQSRTTLIWSGRLAWMRQATFIGSTTTVVGRTWHTMPNTCSNYSTTHSASLRSSDATLLVMPRRLRTLPRRSVVCPKRMVLCVSSSKTWRVTFVTRSRNSQTVTVVRLSMMRSYSGTVSF